MLLLVDQGRKMSLIVSEEEDKVFDFSQYPSMGVGGEPRKLVMGLNYLLEEGCPKPCSMNYHVCLFGTAISPHLYVETSSQAPQNVAEFHNRIFMAVTGSQSKGIRSKVVQRQRDHVRA